MKLSGVIRRIDNLGRIVIPKEIRKILRIQSGDNLEIFLDEDENIVLRKYFQIDKLNEISDFITNALAQDNTAFITNNDRFIAGSGIYKKDYLNHPISEELLNILNSRKCVFKKNTSMELSIKTFNGDIIISPIISSGDALGLIIVLGDNLTENDEKIVKTFATFLAKYIE